MTGKKIISAILAAVLLVFTAAGCAAPSNQADTDAVSAALEKFRACKSFTVIQTSVGKETVTIDGEEYVYIGSTETEISIVTSPAQLKTVTTARMETDSEPFEQVNISYIMPENGGYTEYFYDDSVWYTISTDDDTVLNGIGADFVASRFYVDQISFRKAGESELEGGKATRYDGALGGELLVSMLQANGLLSSISSMSENQQDKIIQDLVKALDNATVSVWVDAASGYPVRFEVSLTKTIKDMEKSINKTLGNKNSGEQYAITDYLMSMTAKDFDAFDSLVLPPETASAQPYDISGISG